MWAWNGGVGNLREYEDGSRRWKIFCLSLMESWALIKNLWDLSCVENAIEHVLVACSSFVEPPLFSL